MGQCIHDPISHYQIALIEAPALADLSRHRDLTLFLDGGQFGYRRISLERATDVDNGILVCQTEAAREKRCCFPGGSNLG